jgi:hypothetical protein
MAFVAVTLLPPAFSLCPHAPPGKKAWWNAKAGAAIMVSIRSDTNATAKYIITLLNRDLLTSLVLRWYIRDLPSIGLPFG